MGSESSVSLHSTPRVFSYSLESPCICCCFSHFPGRIGTLTVLLPHNFLRHPRFQMTSFSLSIIGTATLLLYSVCYLNLPFCCHMVQQPIDWKPLYMGICAYLFLKKCREKLRALRLPKEWTQFCCYHLRLLFPGAEILLHSPAASHLYPHAAQQHHKLTPSCSHISPFSPIHPLVRLSAQFILINFPFLPFLSYTPVPFAFVGCFQNYCILTFLPRGPLWQQPLIFLSLVCCIKISKGVVSESVNPVIYDDCSGSSLAGRIEQNTSIPRETKS